MPYYKILRNIIADTDYTQNEIAQKCMEHGKKIDRTYINKLLNNKLPPPTEEISRTIAKICNVDERLLVIEGYLDKAPIEIREAFINIKYITMLSSLNVLENNIDIKVLNELKKIYEKEPLSDFVIKLLEKGNININISKDYYQLKSKENNLTFNFTTQNLVKITDDSMYPLINENDEIIFEICNKYNDGDILLVKFSNEDNITARQAIFIGNIIRLVPLNKKFKSIQKNINDIDILGKINRVVRKV